MGRRGSRGWGEQDQEVGENRDSRLEKTGSEGLGEQYQEVVENYRTRRFGRIGPEGWREQDQEVGKRKDKEDGENRTRRLARTGSGGSGE